MFWIALELSIPKIGLNIMLTLTVKKLDAFKFDGVAESDNTGYEAPIILLRDTSGGYHYFGLTNIEKTVRKSTSSIKDQSNKCNTKY